MSLATFLDTSASLVRGVAAKGAIAGTAWNYSGTATTFSCALWPRSSDLARMFARDAIVGDWVIATDTDLGVKAQDRIQIGTAYYRVLGFQTFANSGVSSETLYLISCSRMTV
jgi:hypothetical protein